jgi:hypothetical protein
MSPVRRLIVALSFGLGFWVLASFAGTMLDPAHAEPWTTSLMWSLLVSALVSPALLMAYHHTGRPQGAVSRGGHAADATPFVEETPSIEATAGAENQTTLWPEPQDGPDASDRSEEWPWTREDADRVAA